MFISVVRLVPRNTKSTLISRPESFSWFRDQSEKFLWGGWVQSCEAHLFPWRVISSLALTRWRGTFLGSFKKVREYLAVILILLCVRVICVIFYETVCKLSRWEIASFLSVVYIKYFTYVQHFTRRYLFSISCIWDNIKQSFVNKA